MLVWRVARSSNDENVSKESREPWELREREREDFRVHGAHKGPREGPAEIKRTACHTSTEVLNQ